MFSVLLADDSEAFRKPTAAALEKRGYTVTAANNGEEALKLLDQRRPDVVVLDLIMPKVDGMTVLRTMRTKPQFAKTPVIILTGRDSEQVMLEARSLGAYCLLKYCVTLDEICKCVAEHIKQNVRMAV